MGEGLLVAVEGVDGVGKQTLTRALTRIWEQAGVRVARVAFPRYGESITADLAAEALAGDHGGLADSPEAMAVLFALDRAAAAGDLRRLRADHEVVLLDRYVASNAAFTAARLHEAADGSAVRWIERLELGRFALPVPDIQILLDISVDEAARRVQKRSNEDAGRARDAYERDRDLQERTAEVYRDFARRSWLSPWRLVGADPDVPQLAAELLPVQTFDTEMTR